jgi:hypothetical protein
MREVSVKRLLFACAVISSLSGCSLRYAPQWQLSVTRTVVCILSGPNTATIVVTGPKAVNRCVDLSRRYPRIDAVDAADIADCRTTDASGNVIWVLNHWDTVSDLALCLSLQH